MVYFKFPLGKVFLSKSAYRNSMKMRYVVSYQEDRQILLEGFCLPSVHIIQLRICHFEFIGVHGIFQIPSEKIAFFKVYWKVSTRCIYYS